MQYGVFWFFFFFFLNGFGFWGLKKKKKKIRRMRSLCGGPFSPAARGDKDKQEEEEKEEERVNVLRKNEFLVEIMSNDNQVVLVVTMFVKPSAVDDADCFKADAKLKP
jgi:hypothetical protein